MPLDWSAVQVKYEESPQIASHGGGRRLEVTRISAQQLDVSSTMWTKTLEREHLERAVELIEEEVLTNRVIDFVQLYGEHVTKEKRSLAARVLADLGYLN